MAYAFDQLRNAERSAGHIDKKINCVYLNNKFDRKENVSDCTEGKLNRHIRSSNFIAV